MRKDDWKRTEQLFLLTVLSEIVGLPRQHGTHTSEETKELIQAGNCSLSLSPSVYFAKKRGSFFSQIFEIMMHPTDFLRLDNIIHHWCLFPS